MQNLLEQAAIAAEQRNWSFLNQCLQELPLGKTATLRDSDLRQVLSLALNVLEWGDFQERWDVAKVFPKLGQEAIAPLTEILQDEDADLELRWFAGRILGEFNDPIVVKSLVNLLKTSDDEALADMTATTLTNFGISAIGALTDLLTEEESRLLAVRSLGKIRHSETIFPLLSVVGDRQVAVRAAAIEALSSFHDSRIPPVLLDALRDIAAAVRKEAVTGLGLRTDLREELDLINKIKPLLFDFNLEVCTAAAIALGRLGTDDAAEALFTILISKATPIPLQVAVARALSWIGRAKALEYLRQGLTFTSVEVCQEIVTLMGRLEQDDLKPKAAEILIEFLGVESAAIKDTNIKQSLALGLGQLGEKRAIEPLIHLLADTDAGVRLHAIAALKNLASEEAHQKLQQLATQNNLTSELKQGVAIALEEW